MIYYVYIYIYTYTHIHAILMAAISSGGLELASKHSLVMVAGSWHCSRCLKHMPQGSPELAAWFAADCDPGEGESVSRRVGLSRPSSLPEGVGVYACRHQLHQTHALAVFRGLYYCQHWILRIIGP